MPWWCVQMWTRDHVHAHDMLWWLHHCECAAATTAAFTGTASAAASAAAATFIPPVYRPVPPSDHHSHSCHRCAFSYSFCCSSCGAALTDVYRCSRGVQRRAKSNKLVYE